MVVYSSWPDVVVPTLLLFAWLVVSPLPLQLISWLRPSGRRSKHSSLERAQQASLSTTQEEEDKVSSSGYILPVLIHHARMLPKTSQHSFRYPSLFLALKLDDLDHGKLQLSRVFSYTPLASHQWSLSKLDPDGFGRRSFPGIDGTSEMHQCVSRSILLKLLYELRARKYTGVGPQDVLKIDESNPWDKEVGHVWAIAMPTLLGLGGFNPLTVYYVYRPRGEEEGMERRANERGRGELWLVVLEVHNTFNERHVYICQVGVDENKEQRRGYQHAWTFAREFHVSPFNDRLGYYQLLMNDLWSAGEEDTVPTLDVRLLLLSPEKDGQEDSSESEEGTTTKLLHKKLLATLMSSKATSNSLKPSRKGLSMTRANMLRALAAQPFDLVLPVSRIMWQAAKLHWKKGLPVFIRPEQLGERVDGEKQNSVSTTKNMSSTYSGLDWPVDLNPTQKVDKDKGATSSSSGSIYWNQDTFLEKACQSQFEQYIQQQSSRHKDVSFAIVSRNAEVKPCYFFQGRKQLASLRELQDEESKGDTKQISLYTLSSSFYLDFALYTPTQARLFGSLMDRNWGVSSVKDYELFFSFDGEHVEAKEWRSKVAAWARQKHMQWALLYAETSSSPRDKDYLARQLASDVTSMHPYNSMKTPWSFLIALLLQIFVIRLTAALSALLHIRYVRPPWAQVAEGYHRMLEEAE